MDWNTIGEWVASFIVLAVCLGATYVMMRLSEKDD